MLTEEEREFQLEMLKLQIKHQAVWSSVTLAIAVEFATFISIATTYLSFGLTSGNPLSIIIGAFSIVALAILVRLTIYYFQREKKQREFDKHLEKAIQPIRDRFITKKIEQKENREESPITSEIHRKKTEKRKKTTKQ